MIAPNRPTYFENNSFPSLVELALRETIKGFSLGRVQFRAESCLKPETAATFYERLRPPTDENLETFASCVENDEYWKRACDPKGHTESEEYGLSHKRMFVERRLRSILETGEEGGDHDGGEKEAREAMMGKIRLISNYIHTVKLSGTESRLPIDILCCNLPNLMNINLNHAPGLIEGISKASVSSPLLSTLVLTESQVTDDETTLMIDKLADSPTLLHLDLSHNKITSKGAKAIADRLIAPPESIMSYLDLSGNRVSSEGASLMGKALATNESLLSLALRLNAIGDEGGKDLFDGLFQNSTLRHLNLSANNLGSSSAEVLLRVLGGTSQARALESIVLTSNSFADEELTCLGQCKTLPVIDLRMSSKPTKSSDSASLASEMPCS